MNLVLNHGIFGFATLGDVVYFNGVKAFLLSKFPGLRILTAQVAPDGSIEVRGNQLREQITEALQNGVLDSNETVHIIAHSMGGLDARFLLSPDNPQNMGNLVASLTTISTPHKGSQIADVVVAAEDIIGSSPEAKLIAQAVEASMAHAHIFLGGLRNLTIKAVKSFNDNFRDNDSTKKFSVAGVGRGIQFLGVDLDTCAVLRLPHRIIKESTGEDNDGLVSLSSATWGEGPELWPADHADEIGHNLDGGLKAPTTNFDYLAKYEALVSRLQQL